MAGMNFPLEHFIEEVGLMFERSGMPRMAGRILGWLLVCDPPAQTASQLAQGLHASKGSISTMTRLLLQAGLIEQVARKGERQTRFQIRDQAWIDLMVSRLAGVRVYREMADRGLAALAEAPPERRKRLQTMRNLYAFFEDELPQMVQRLKHQLEHHEGN